METIRISILSKGAEAILYLELWYGTLVVKKVRIPKRYRNSKLDLNLRRTRTISEAKLLCDAKRLGVCVPSLIDVDLLETSITMEYVTGRRIRDIVEDLTYDKLVDVFGQVGKSVGKLHINGIVHGDLTTSNMILTPSGSIYLIDFGLGGYSWDIEDLGTDIHLMLRALESTHTRVADLCFKAFIRGYREIMGKRTLKILDKVKEIRSRGRYVSAEVRRR